MSEAANVLKTCFSISDLADLMESFHSKENITVTPVTEEDYLSAIHSSKTMHCKINDCLLAVLMEKYKIKELYTFDKDFKAFDWIKACN